jgi:hypothetical protein
MKLTKRGENVAIGLSITIIVILGSAIDSLSTTQLLIIAGFTVFVSIWHWANQRKQTPKTDTPIGDKLAKEMRIKLDDKNRAA